MRRLILLSAVAGLVALLTPLTASAATAAAQITNCPPAFGCFNPNPIRVTVGDRVTWTNNTSITHTATSDSGVWDTGSIAPGASSGAVTFSSVGTFAYHCAIHPSMTGSVIVSAAAAARPPVRLAPGGGGSQLPIGAALLLLGFLLLARRHRTQRVGEGIDELPYQ